MSKWPLVKLGEVLHPSEDWITIDPSVKYREVTVRLWGKGVVERGEVFGSKIAASTRLRVHTGEFIFSRIDARNGALGIVPEHLDGAVVSGDFPTYGADPGRLLPSFLGWLCRMPAFVDMCRSASEGTTNRVRIKEDRLMASQIPLPPIDEQRRLVRIAHGASERITEAADLRRAIRERSDQLCRAVFAENGGAALTPTPMSELVEWRTLDTDVEADGSYRFAGVYCFGRGVFAGECRSGTEFAYKRLTRLRPGDLVYPKLMAWEGALGIVPETCDGLYVSPEFPVFSVKSDRVLPETLDTYFRDPAVWPALGGVSTGTNVRRRRLNPKDFLKYEFPLPSMRTQLRLREIRARLSGIEAEAGHVARDLDALLPSILDRAFRGEL